MQFRHVDSWEDEGGTPSERPSTLAGALLLQRVLDRIGSFERVVVRTDSLVVAELSEDARRVVASLDGVSTLGRLVDVVAVLGLSHERILDAIEDLARPASWRPVSERPRTAVCVLRSLRRTCWRARHGAGRGRKAVGVLGLCASRRIRFTQRIRGFPLPVERS